MRDWKCQKCAQSNRTVVALDGTAKCPQCGTVLAIQRNRDYLGAFSSLHPELLTWNEGRWL
ncbi:MAG: hypothetical protein ABI968_13480 [Acidobacteriota bacterium]